PRHRSKRRPLYRASEHGKLLLSSGVRTYDWALPMKMFPSADFLSIGRCILVVWLLAASAQAQTVATTRRAPAGTPVVLISVDTLRADRLSCYGDRDHVTSNIDAFANGGTLFSGASALVPLTLPSHASLLTSTYPFCH